jgi:hypothetical protein
MGRHLSRILRLAAPLLTALAVQPALAATTSCVYNQTSGSGATLFATCETVNGNVVQFTSPSGIEHIRIGTYEEGYGLCDSTNISNPLRYFDWAGGGDSAGKGAGFIGWNTALKVSSSPLTISRTTADGQLTLKQVFTRTNSSYTMRIAMTVVNHGAAKSIALSRLVDIDANNNTANDFFSSADSVLGLVQFAHGLQITGLSAATAHNIGVAPFGQTPETDPCGFSSGSPNNDVDRLGTVQYMFKLAQGAAKTVSVEYRRF